MSGLASSGNGSAASGSAANGSAANGGAANGSAANGSAANGAPATGLRRLLPEGRPRTAHLVQIALLLTAVGVPLLGPSAYLAYLGTSAVISGLLLLSVGIVIGDTGMASLCQVSFAGVGAWIMTRFGAAGHPLGLPLEILVTCLGTGAVGVLVALPAMRLRAVNLAVVTLGIASAVDVFLSGTGFPLSPTGQSIDLPDALSSNRGLFAASLVLFAVVVVAVTWLRAGPVGATWISVRSSERAAAASGVSVVIAKASAFGVSAVVAALSGIVLLAQLGITSSNNFPVAQSLILFAVGRFIGSWRWQGAVMAGILNVAVPELLAHVGVPNDWFNVLFALGAIQALATGGSVADGIWPRRRTAAAVGELREENWGAGATTAPAVDRPALSVEGLSVRFGGLQALDDVGLDVATGMITGLLGANGAGKTTFIDAVTGFISSSGAVRVAGRPLQRGPRRRARSGLRRTFQQDRLPGALTVGAYLRLAAGRRLDAEERALLLGFVELPSADVLVDDLDAARRRLVEVAAAFAAKPDVVLLDEPVAGLSGAEALVFARRLRRAPAVFGAAVLLIEHDLDFVRAVCGHVVVLDFGRVIARGTPEEILANPLVRVAYLGEAVRDDDARL